MMQDSDYGNLALSLVRLLQEDGVSTNVKQQAGLYLKNTLAAKDSFRLTQMQDRWVTVEPSLRQEIKVGLLKAIEQPDVRVQKVTSQIIAKVFAAEVKISGWPELISSLSSIVHQATAHISIENNAQLAQMGLTALGYVCEEMNEDHANQEDINTALTAIIANMESPVPQVIEAAVNALRNAIHLTGRNFEIDSERDMIVKMLCQAATSKDARVRVVGFESLALIAEKFYGKLGAYMEGIYSLTVSALKQDEDQVQVVAIEFWSTLAEVEDDILYETAQHPGVVTMASGSEPCMNYIKAVAPHLVPVLLECLMRQDEYDEDAWNAAKASAACLELIANVVKDDIMPQILPLLDTNLRASSWRNKEAAAMALGSVIQGPSVRSLVSNVDTKMIDLILPLIKDSNEMLRDTSVWLLSRIAKYAPEILMESGITDKVIGHVMESLDDTPKVAKQGLSFIYNLATHTIKHPANTPGGSALGTSTAGIVRKVHQLAEKCEQRNQGGMFGMGRDSGMENVCSLSYETIMQLVRASGGAAERGVVIETLQYSLSKITQSLNLQNPSLPTAVINHQISESKFDQQTHLVGIIEACLSVADSNTVTSVASQVINVLIHLLHSKNQACYQDCLRTAGIVAQEIGPSFGAYMNLLWPYLLNALKDFGSSSTYITAVLAISDVSRSVDSATLLPYCDEILEALLNGLSSPTVESRAKPPTLSAIGDVALAITSRFVRYAPAVMSVLHQATEFEMPLDDEQHVALRTELWEGILTAYSGVIIGLKEATPAEFADAVQIHTKAIIGFVNKIANTLLVEELNPVEPLLRAICGLMGDLASGCGPSIALELRNPVAQRLIEVSASSPSYSQKTKDAAWYARQAVFGGF